MIKHFINKKGSLTVEAAIVLPIFICVILTIGFFIKIVHTHEIIQYAINETVNEMASSSYLYYSSGLYDLETELFSDFDVSKEDIENTVNEYKTKFDDIKSQFNNINENGNDFDNILQLYDLIQQAENLLNPQKLRETLIDVKNVAVGEGYDYIKTQAGNLLVKKMIEKYLLTSENQEIEDRLKELYIADKTNNNLHEESSYLYGLDFSRSRYLVGNDQIDIIVVYKIDLPLPLDFIDGIPMIQRATARAWLGGNNPSTVESFFDREEEKKDITVFITKTGERYHRGDCFHLRMSKIPVKLSEVVGEDDKYTPCLHCKPPATIGD